MADSSSRSTAVHRAPKRWRVHPAGWADRGLRRPRLSGDVAPL